MRQIGILLLASAMVFTYSISAKAELYDRGGGLIYDSDLDITWLQDANYAMTCGYDADGRMAWEQANAWAGQLTYGGYEGWRLPKTLPVNGSTYIYPNQDFYDGSGDIGGYNISAPGSVYAGSKASELSYFYYNTLKNLGAFDLNGNFNPNWSQLQVGPFSGVQISKYWSATDYDSLPGTAFSFNTDGGQNIDWKYEEHFVWAVRDGDVAFCVTSSTELQNALTTASGNGKDDVIRLVQGTYNGNFVYSSTEPYGVTIEGGYTANCSSRDVNPENTVLMDKTLGESWN